jgi:membrane associated rhomboid family serine protease
MIPIRGSLRGPAVPALTVALVAANLLAFLHEATLPPVVLERFIQAWGLVPARETASGSVAVALFFGLTAMFVHGGWAHVLWNMLYLWVFGSGLESRLGHARFFVLYVAAGLVATQAQAWLSPFSTTPIVGASGAIAGVLGAYFIVSPRAWLTVVLPIWIIPFVFQIPAVVYLALWFLQQFLSGFVDLAAQASGGIAWWAHVAGFVAGALFVRILGVPPEAPVARPSSPWLARDPW